MLLPCIGISIKGELQLPPNTNWVKKAGSMAPSAFAALFDGEPNALAQSLAKDLKLMDALFQCTVAPYIRT